MGNGKTYILNDEPIMTTRHTVRDILAAHSEYSKFLELMDGSGLFETIHNNKYACGGTNISLFNTYHYTVYVPTNESIEKLQKQGKPAYLDTGRQRRGHTPYQRLALYCQLREIPHPGQRRLYRWRNDIGRL